MSRQKIGGIFLEPENLMFENKTGLGQIRNQDFCRSRRMRFHQAVCKKHCKALIHYEPRKVPDRRKKNEIFFETASNSVKK